MNKTGIVLNRKFNMSYLIIMLMVQYSDSKLPLRIYNGTDANADEYNYVVRLEIQRYFRRNSSRYSIRHYHLCTTSALSPTWAISAAHCVEDLHILHSGRLNNTGKLVIRYGHVEHLPKVHDSFSKVLFAVLHPLYATSYPIGYMKMDTKHDVCLLKTSPMNIKAYLKLSAIEYKFMYGHEAIVAGFGITTKILSDGKIKTDDTLRLKKPLQILKVLITKCNRDYFIPPGLCIQSRCDQVAALCGGDSGGPLIHPSGLIEVLSEGDATRFCLKEVMEESTSIVSIIVPTSQYIEWIYSYITMS